jgi:hypothetical protein
MSAMSRATLLSSFNCQARSRPVFPGHAYSWRHCGPLLPLHPKNSPSVGNFGVDLSLVRVESEDAAAVLKLSYAIASD